MNGRKALALSLVALLSVVSFSVTPTLAQTGPGTFVIASVGSPLTLPINPLIRRGNPRTNFWMFDSLVGYTHDMKAKGQLAERWDLSPDGRTYTFHLRRNVKWHDGRAFTADDVVFTAESALDLKNASPIRRNYLVDGQPVRVEKIDQYTVRYTLPRPHSLFMFYMAGWNLIVPKHLLEGKDLASADFNANPVGTGPFKFAEIRDRQFIRLVANPDYYQGRSKLDTWILRDLGDQSAALAALARGEIDFIRADNREGVETAKRIPGVQVYSYPAGWIFAFNMNHKATFFGDVRVRQAIAYAIPREAMVKTIAGDMPVAWSYAGPPDSWAYNPEVPKYPKDVDRAKNLLREAGLQPGPGGVLQKDGKPFRFTVIIQSPASDSDPESFAVAFRDALKAVGIDMEIQRLDRPTLEKRLFEERNFEAYLWWNGSNYEPEPRFYWHSKDAWGNRTLADGTVVDRFIEQYEAAVTQAARKRALDQLVFKLARDADFIPLYYNYGFMAARSNIRFPRPSAADFNNTGVLYDVHTIEKTR